MRKNIALIRKAAITLVALTVGFANALEVPAGGSLMLNLDSTTAEPDMTLAGDTVLSWGPFSLMNTNNLPPIVTNIAGVQAVHFFDTGDSHLRSEANAPAALEGGNPWSIEVWMYSASPFTHQCLVGWGDDQADNGRGQAVVLGYGVDAQSGAARHGTDVDNYNLGYHGARPPTGQWHLLTLTYTGSSSGQQLERVYANGVLLTGRDGLILNVRNDTRMHLGTLFRPASSGFIQRYIGALARVRLHSGALSHSQVIANYNQEADDFGRQAITEAINIFEGIGAWTTTSLWSAGTVADTGEQAIIAGDAVIDSAQSADLMTVAGSLSLEGAAASLETIGPVTVGYGAGTLRLSDGAAFTPGVSNDLSFIAGFRRNGSVSVTNAALTVTNGIFALGHESMGIGYADFNNASNRFKDVYIGYLARADGTLYQTNGTFESTGFLYIGEQAYGHTTFEDTDVTVQGNLVVGRNSDGVGSYIQRGGTLKIYGTAAAVSSGGSPSSSSHAQGHMSLNGVDLYSKPYFSVGNAKGTFAATGCVITCDSYFTSGNTSGSKGFAQVVNSQISATSFYIGRQNASYGELECANSVITTLNFRTGVDASSTGSITLANCSVTATTDVYAGYDGVGALSNIASTIRTPILGVAQNSGTTKGYMYCGSGSTTEVTSAAFQVGRYGTGTVDCHGFVDVQASNLGLYIGNLADAEGTVNLYTGAEVHVRNMIVLGYTRGTGTLNQYGGALFVTNNIRLGGYNSSFSDAKGTYNLHGGTVTVYQPVYVGQYGKGELTVNGGEAVFPHFDHGLTVGTFVAGDGGASTGTVNLVAGTLGVARVRGVNGYSEFFFDGGELKALANNTSFCQGLTKAEVRAGGAKIDSNGRDITIAQSIAHDSRDGAPAKDGGLTKLGAGTLTMTGTLGFTGDLGANGGTLDLSAASYALPSGSGLWGNGTLVPPSGGFSVPADGWVAPGDTSGVGTLTVTGNLTLNGEIRARVSPDGTECGTLAVGGTLFFPAGSELTIENPDDMAEGSNYTFVTASAFNGQPTVLNLPRLWSLKVSPTQIRAVYISGTMISVR